MNELVNVMTDHVYTRYKHEVRFSVVFLKTAQTRGLMEGFEHGDITECKSIAFYCEAYTQSIMREALKQV